MRFDTHRISAFLVEELQRARPLLQVMNDGGDLIHVSLATGETVYIYLIESPLTLYEIRGIIEANTTASIYTLFILWGEMFLPVEGSRYIPDDWMETLLALGRDKIYSFDAYGGDSLIFPVYFEGESRKRLVRYGTPIRVTRLNCELVTTRSHYISGRWAMADFEPSSPQEREQLHDPLSGYYHVLGVHRQGSRALVKRAYHRLARQFHPDVNQTPEATARMQQINDAYERIMRTLDK